MIGKTLKLRYRSYAIAPPILDDNEGLEMRALDNTWTPDKPVPPPQIQIGGQFYNVYDSMTAMPKSEGNISVIADLTKALEAGNYEVPSVPIAYIDPLGPPHGYITVNGQTIRADTVFEHLGGYDWYS